MGKKTKSQKIIAELRRKIKAKQIETKASQEQKLEITPQVKPEVEKTDSIIKNIKKSELVVLNSNLNFIKKDLLKTFFLTIIVISLELMLYWSFEYNGLRILQNFLPKKF